MAPKGSKGNQKNSAITQDSRFSSVHNDPRFRMPKRKDFKVELDDRFKESDLKSLEKRSNIDKYGRKIQEGEDAKAFKKYYKTNNDEEEKVEEEEEDDSEEASEEEEITIIDRARGDVAGDAELSNGESSSDEESSDENDSDDDSDMEVEDTKPEAGDPERRFAVVNLDWDHVRSTDLMATFQSFVPASGLIESVSIYPSEFGKERLQKEEIEGPPKDVFRSKKKKHHDDDSDSEAELEAKDLYEEDDGKEDYDPKSLRRYQLQRLRYYYAVVTCDSVETAKNIYENCDGTEYESTANFFDLRFIPDEMEFEDDEPRDSCTKIPSNYKPESFVTDALQHSKVKLTWDETPAERVKLSSKSFSQRELDDMDFKAYLASDNSDDEDEGLDADMKNKYRNLVGASTKIGNKDIFAKGNDNNDDVDMEITFTPGLDSSNGEVPKEAKNPDEESTIDKLKRKAKERRKARKDKIKESQQPEAEEEVDVKDKKSRSKGKKSNKENDEKSKAELELLMLDEGKESKAQHFNLKELVRSEKEKSKKSKHRNKDKIIEDGFEADLNDPRFNEIFTNHDFAIDPSQPQFKKTSTMKKILEERNKRRDDHNDEAPKPEKKQTKKRKLQEDESNEGSLDVKSLVQKLKRKAKK